MFLYLINCKTIVQHILTLNVGDCQIFHNLSIIIDTRCVPNLNKQLYRRKNYILVFG